MLYIAIMEQSFYYKTLFSPLVCVQHASSDIVYSTSKCFGAYLHAQPEQKGQGNVQVWVFPYKPQLAAQQEHL